MKSFKFLGIAVATLGIAASVGGAVALYRNSIQDITLGISSGTYETSEGNITYKINGATSGTVTPEYFTAGDTPVKGDKFSPQYSQVKYSFPLSATYDSGLTKQEYTHGNLSVSITNVPEAFRGKISIWTGIDGYVANTMGKTLFEHCFNSGNDYAITNEHTSYEEDHDVTVTSDGGQTLVVWMKYTLTDAEFLALNESSLTTTVSVKWKAAIGDVAYVVGDGNGWQLDEDFAMAKDIGNTNGDDQWIYNGLVGKTDEWTQVKARLSDGTWAADPNKDIANGKTYNVYWKGNNSEQTYVAEVTA